MPPRHDSAPPVQTIRLRLGDSLDERMEVNIVHRAGETRVSVRTDNPDLTQRLRSELPELAHELTTQGLRAEIRTNSAELDKTATRLQTDTYSHEDSRDRSFGQQQQEHPAPDEGDPRQHSNARRRQPTFEDLIDEQPN